MMRLKEYKTDAQLDEGIAEVITRLKDSSAKSMKDGYAYAKMLFGNIKQSRITKAVVRLAVNIAYRVTIGSFMEACRGSWRNVVKYIKRNNLSYEFVAIINMVFNNNYRALEDIERDSIKLPMAIVESTIVEAKGKKRAKAKKLASNTKAVKMVREAIAAYVPYMSAVKLVGMLINGKYKNYEFSGEKPSNYDICLAIMWVILINTRSLQDLNINWSYLKREDQLYIGRKEALNIGYNPREAMHSLPDGSPAMDNFHTNRAMMQSQNARDEFDTEFVDPETEEVYGKLPGQRGRF